MLGGPRDRIPQPGPQDPHRMIHARAIDDHRSRRVREGKANRTVELLTSAAVCARGHVSNGFGPARDEDMHVVRDNCWVRRRPTGRENIQRVNKHDSHHYIREGTPWQDRCPGKATCNAGTIDEGRHGARVYTKNGTENYGDEAVLESLTYQHMVHDAIIRLRYVQQTRCRRLIGGGGMFG